MSPNKVQVKNSKSQLHSEENVHLTFQFLVEATELWWKSSCACVSRFFFCSNSSARDLGDKLFKTLYRSSYVHRIPLIKNLHVAYILSNTCKMAY